MKRYVLLDYIRAVAAILVCIGHLRAALFVDYSQLASPHLSTQVLYLLTSLGHQAVMVFFVLSGYLVGGAVLTSTANFSWRRYGIARLSRLWIVLLPCLLLTWMIDGLILYWAPEVLSGYAAQHWHSGPKLAEFDQSLLTALGNVFFLQTIAVPVFGSNGPLWSLANEFWYYICFPLLLVGTGVLKENSWRRRVFAAVALLCVSVVFPVSIVQGFVVWLMGAGVALVVRSGVSFGYSSWQRWFSVSLWIVGVVVSWFCEKRQIPILGDWLLGACFSVFLIVHLSRIKQHQPTADQRGVIAQYLVPLSDMSFSLYLSHFPLVLGFGAILSMHDRLQPTWLAWGTLLACLCVLIALARLIWWTFERHTDSIRRRANTLLNPVSASA